ncbi:MAG: hypothetical protein NT150_08970 [Bacteroidetes bacterium]|nr:hypothetical protein [Bacteroidota bacterium]
MKKSLLFLFLLVIFSSCSKEQNKRWIEGRLIFVETNQPIKNHTIYFNVFQKATGPATCFGGLGCSDGSGWVSGKYFATSDDNGYFSFKIESSDVGQPLSVGRTSLLCDSINYSFELQDENNRAISKHENTTLYLTRKKNVEFVVPSSIWEEFKTDTIIVRSGNNNDSIIHAGPLYGQCKFYLVPNQVHTFNFIVIKNNAIFKQVSKEIFITQPCPDYSKDYLVNFE